MNLLNQWKTLILFTLTRSLLKKLLNNYRKEWEACYYDNSIFFEEFRGRLYETWLDGIQNLKILLEFSREVGDRAHRKFNRSKSKKGRVRTDLLIRLHVRACQVTAEIISLLENGYADGAMARWRTLHEISVVSMLISDNGDELSERYLAHDIVESKRAMDQYQTCHGLLGFRQIPLKEAKLINSRFAEAVSKYGKEFAEPYGWAFGFSATL